MPQRIQINRTDEAGFRPLPLALPSGVLHVNFADRQISAIFPDGGHQDLIGLPFHAETSAYEAGNLVRRAERILRAAHDIPADTPFSETDWSSVEGAVPVGITAPVGPSIGAVWIDTSGTYPEFRHFTAPVYDWERVNAGYLRLSGLDTMAGPLGLQADTGLVPALRFGSASPPTSGIAWNDGHLQIVHNGVLLADFPYEDSDDPSYDPTVLVQSLADLRYLQLSGDALTGPLLLAGAPEAPLEAATKGYVDTLVGGAIVASAEQPPEEQGILWYDPDGTLWIFDGAEWVEIGGAAKVSKAGDTMTGHLEVPVGGVNAEVLQAQYVLQKGGDFMIGLLTLDRAAGMRIPQRTNGYVDLHGDSLTPVDGIRMRFSGTAVGGGGTSGTLVLQAGDTANWIGLTPTTQTISLGTSQLLRVTGSLDISNNLTLYNEIILDRTDGNCYITSSGSQDLSFRRGADTAAVIVASGTAAGSAKVVITREKGDERYLRRDGGVPVPLNVQLDLNGLGIYSAGRIRWTGYGADYHDFIDWDTGNGLRGYENDNLVFTITNLTTDATASAANLNATSGGTVRRSSSSGDHKHDVKPIQGMIPKLMALKPVTFRSLHQADEPNDVYMGFLAEDVAGSLPEAVTGMGGRNYDTRAIVALHTAVLQEVAPRVLTLENDVRQLQTQMTVVIQKVQALENRSAGRE